MCHIQNKYVLIGYKFRFIKWLRCIKILSGLFLLSITLVRCTTYNLDDSLRCDSFSRKQTRQRSMDLCVYPSLHEFSIKNTSPLVSCSTSGQPACIVAQMEVSMFMLEVNKAASALIQPSFCKYTAVAEQWASRGERRGDLATPNQSLTDYC